MRGRLSAGSQWSLCVFAKTELLPSISVSSAPARPHVVHARCRSPSDSKFQDGPSRAVAGDHQAAERAAAHAGPGAGRSATSGGRLGALAQARLPSVPCRAHG